MNQFFKVFIRHTLIELSWLKYWGVCCWGCCGCCWAGGGRLIRSDPPAAAVVFWAWNGWNRDVDCCEAGCCAAATAPKPLVVEIVVDVVDPSQTIGLGSSRLGCCWVDWCGWFEAVDDDSLTINQSSSSSCSLDLSIRLSNCLY